MTRQVIRDGGTALSFPGSAGNSISLGTTPAVLNALTSFSVGFVIKPYTGNNTTVYTTNLTSTGGFEIRFNGGSKNIQVVKSGVAVLMNNTIKPIPFAQFSYIVLTFNNTTGILSLYLNGSLYDTATPGALTFTNNDYFIGKKTGDFFGVLDNFRIYNRELSASEVSSLYFQDTIPTGLVLEYLLNEGSGSTVVDTSGSGINGTITGAIYTLDTPYKTHTMSRNNGSCLQFLAPPNGKVNLGAVFNYPNNFTVGAWIYPPTAITATNRIFSVENCWGFGFNATGNLLFTTYNILDYVASGTLSQPPLNTWIHVLVVLDSNNAANFYFNGNLINKITGSGAATTNNASASIGSRLSTEYFNGYIDDVNIWNRSLSAAEIKSLVNTDTVPTNGLQGSYQFNEGTGTTTADSSGNNINGTFQGTGISFSAATRSKARLVNRDTKTALAFTGNNQTVANTAAVNLPSALGSWSMGIYIKFTAYVQTTFFGIYDNAIANQATFSYQNGSKNLVVSGAGGRTFVSVGNIQLNTWYYLVYTFDGTTNRFYINGSISNTSTTSPDTLPSPTTVRLSTYNGSAEGLAGNVDEAYIWNRTLTAAEVSGLYQAGNVPSGVVVGWNFNEGAGTTAIDTSGNGNAGTITGATYSRDVTSINRSAVNQNLVRNGNFEFAPPFVAATTTNGVWIDGTATGSVNNDIFGWSTNFGGTSSARFDNTTFNSGSNSLKLSTLAVSSYATSPTNRNFISANIPQYAISVLPSTSYTVTYYMKTNLVSGSSTTGAQFAILEEKGIAGGVTSTVSSPITTTTPWTQYSITFTTNVLTRFIDFEFRLSGNNGAGTLIMDAWIDDITMVPTTPITRQLA